MSTEIDGERLIIEKDDTVIRFGINRPEKRNALDQPMASAFLSALDDASHSPCVIVVHSTTPGMFVAGADIAELLQRDGETTLRGPNVKMFARLAAHRWPTISAVDGDALGGGCELAMSTDFRIASSRARFGQPELGLGIMAGAGGNWRLPQLVGLAKARRLLYTGEIISADEALSIGLVDEVCAPEELMERADSLAKKIAKRSWPALELTKLALAAQGPDTTTFDLAAQALLFEGSDKQQRMQAFLDRKKD